MRVAVVYILPTTQAHIYQPMARHFANTYIANPPGKTDHEIYVAVNGSVEPGAWCEPLFHPIPVHYFQHNNAGKDIGAYQAAADIIDSDLQVCLGAPVHFHRAGWLDRMVDAFTENGPAMYGCWGFQYPLPHLRTTCFWLPPNFLNSYPHRVGDGGRYAFEHSAGSMTLWSQQLGFEPMMVTWNDCRTMKQWDAITRDEGLVIDQHCVRHNIK